jgi:hypothetical protein
MERTVASQSRPRRTLAELHAVLDEGRIALIRTRYLQGGTVRAIGKEVRVRRDVVSDVLNSGEGAFLRPGRRTNNEIARRVVTPAARVPPPRPYLGPPVSFDLWYVPEDRNQAAWRFYTGPCGHRGYPSCIGHSIAHVALSLGKNYLDTRDLLAQQAAERGEAFPVHRGRRPPPDHPLPALKPRPKGGA